MSNGLKTVLASRRTLWIIGGCLPLIGLAIFGVRYFGSNAVDVGKPSQTKDVSSVDFVYTEKGLKEEFARHRTDYPLVSMEARLPVPRISVRPKELPPPTTANLKNLEEKISAGLEMVGPDQIEGQGWRADRLKKIHEDHWKEFVGSSKFGWSRRFSGVVIVSPPPSFPETPVAQPGPEFPPLLSTGQLGPEPGSSDLSALLGLHTSSFIDFVNPFGFGYVKDRRNVAGFQSHGFRHVHKNQGWKVQRVDLVGMLLHDEPVVYLTNGQPRMEEAVKAPTRLLNVFEELGLESLKNGDDLFVRESPDGLRMLGSLRAVEQCVQCHGCKRGDLLGVFSYCLVRDR